MQIYQNLNEWQQVRTSSLNAQSIGFVPTMGNLHAGHASLFARCKQENDCAVASLFINPTQFNQPADFKHYPRTLDADLALLEQMGVDHCLLPDEQAMYRDGYRYQLDENQLAHQMEGRQRPGHFTGVLTVVMKLLNLVKPTQAYFGEKDYQQLQLIRGMVDAFFMDITIKGCPTIRETSGLAYSSRNNRLTDTQRQSADQFASIFHQDLPCERIIQSLESQGITVDYIEEHEGRRYAAVFIGDVRLIDNYAI